MIDMQREVAETMGKIRSHLSSANSRTADILHQVNAGTVLGGWEIAEAAKLARELQDALNYLGLLMWKLRREKDPAAKHPAEMTEA